MRAAYYERTGRADEVLLVGELSDPQPEQGEVRVRVEWSGVNPSDVKARAGSRGTTLPFPCIVPHSDGMGMIDAVGEGADPKRIGERVWTWNGAWERASGTAAQYVALPERQAVASPDNVPGEVGACLGIPALTALHAVLCDGGVVEGNVEGTPRLRRSARLVHTPAHGLRLAHRPGADFGRSLRLWGRLRLYWPVLNGARQGGLPPAYIADIEGVAAVRDLDAAREARELSIYAKR